MDFADRLMRVYSALGIDYLERGLIVTLLLEPGPWRTSSLADYMGMNRATVYRRLKLRESQGVCKQTPDGWISTDFGHEGGILLVNEIAAVVLGEKTRLSDEVVQLSVMLNSKARRDMAETLSFSGTTI